MTSRAKAGIYVHGLELDSRASNTRVCDCGYSVGDPWVVPKQKYSLFGWFVMSCGISYPPKLINIECDRCGEIFNVIEGDRKFLDEYMRLNR